MPHEDDTMKLRILIAAHTGIGGHRSKRLTLAAVSAYFYWDNMKYDVQSFVFTCLHCLCSQTGKSVPRPLGHALHATEPNNLLHFDFCFMSKGENGFSYVLVCKDDHSSYVWLTSTKDTTAETVSEVLIRWFAAFGTVEQ